MTVVISGDSGIVVSGNTNTLSGITVSRGAGSVATNTAVGASALAANTTGAYNSAFGYGALASNEGGTFNTAAGRYSLNANTSGTNNTGLGHGALGGNTSGAYNVAVGRSSLESNTTASNNTAVGYQAGYTNSTGAANTFIGQNAGYSATGAQNTFSGAGSGYSTTGSGNTFVGYTAGYNVSSGAKNTIIGQYNGNQGGLDIRTASNYIVLSDGDGNPRAYCDNAGKWIFNSGLAYTVGIETGNQITFSRNGANYIAANGGTSATVVVVSNSNGVVLNNGATSWSSFSDERLKDIIEPINDATNKVSSLRAVIGKYKTEEEGTRRSFLIAQDVQAVLPEAVVEVTKENGESYLSLAYTEVIPLLVAAIQELKAQVDAQAAEIATLKGQA